MAGLVIIISPASDATLTTDNVAEVIELVNDWDSLQEDTLFIDEDMIVPSDRLSVIENKFSTKRDIVYEYASYYVHCHPRVSWTHLASCLYYYGEFTVVKKLKPYLPLRGKQL